MLSEAEGGWDEASGVRRAPRRHHWACFTQELLAQQLSFRNYPARSLGGCRLWLGLVAVGDVGSNKVISAWPAAAARAGGHLPFRCPLPGHGSPCPLQSQLLEDETAVTAPRGAGCRRRREGGEGRAIWGRGEAASVGAGD